MRKLLIQVFHSRIWSLTEKLKGDWNTLVNLKAIALTLKNLKRNILKKGHLTHSKLSTEVWELQLRILLTGSQKSQRKYPHVPSSPEVSKSWQGEEDRKKSPKPHCAWTQCLRGEGIPCTITAQPSAMSKAAITFGFWGWLHFHVGAWVFFWWFEWHYLC